MDTLTVEEMLLYTAELKRAQREPLARKREAVDVLITDLALETCRHTRIGNAMDRGISGGQVGDPSTSRSIVWGIPILPQKLLQLPNPEACVNSICLVDWQRLAFVCVLSLSDTTGEPGHND